MAARKYIESLRRQEAESKETLFLQRAQHNALTPQTTPLPSSLDWRPAGNSLTAHPPELLLPSAMAAIDGGAFSNTGSNNNASFRSGGSDVIKAREVLEEYRTTASHLEKRIGAVRVVLDEFFDDVGMAVVRKSEETEGLTTRLQQISSALRRVPLLPQGWQQFPPPRREKQKVVKRDSIMNLFSNLIHRDQDRKLLTLDLTMVVLGLLTILLMLVADYLTWIVPAILPPSRTQSESLPLPVSPNATLPPPGPPATPVPMFFTPAPPGSTNLENVIGTVRVGTVLILHYIMFVLALGFAAVLSLYYRYKLQFLRVQWSKMGGKQVLSKSDAYSFWRSSLFPQYLLELAIFMIMPYPWYNQLQSQDAKYLQIFMFTRLYLLLRFLYHYSKLYRQRNFVNRSSDFLKRAGFRIEFVDAMKVYLFENTVVTVALMYIAVLTVGGFCVFVAERNANSNSVDDPEGINGFSSFFNGVYFMMMAIRTIGYGDIKPKTIIGRTLTIIFQFTGTTVEALIASVVVNKIAKTKEEKIVDEYLGSFVAWCELRVASAMVVQAFWKTCRRYNYLHRKASEEQMQQLLRAMKRRKDYLRVLQINRAKNAVRDTDGSTVSVQLRQEENHVQHDVNFKQILRHFATAEKIHRTKRRGGDGSIFGVYSMTQNLEEEREETFRRMPYLRERETSVSAQDLIDRDRHLFSQNIDVLRWNRTIGNKVPRGFQNIRKFTSTKKVIGKYGERRVPIGSGHKADVRLEALQKFREARIAFKRSIAPSSDHVIDTKMQIAYELLAAASKTLRRNIIMLQGLKRAVKVEVASMQQLVKLSLSGGKPPPST